MGVLISWDTLPMKSFFIVSMLESSSTIVLKSSNITSM